jgi:acyl-CoA reductase-like NAD-dependent aldehyde dehydrogenase
MSEAVTAAEQELACDDAIEAAFAAAREDIRRGFEDRVARVLLRLARLQSKPPLEYRPNFLQAGE